MKSQFRWKFYLERKTFWIPNMGLKNGLFFAVIMVASAVASAGLLLPAPKPVPKMTCDAPIAQTKSGRCPKQLLAIQCVWCNDLCKSDNDCPGNSKCCPQPSCGNMCASPVYEEKVPEKGIPKKTIPLPVPDKVIPPPKKVIPLTVPDKVQVSGKLVPGTIIPGPIIPVPVPPKVIPLPEKLPVPTPVKTIQILPEKLVPGTVLPIPGTLIPLQGKGIIPKIGIPDKLAPLVILG